VWNAFSARTACIGITYINVMPLSVFVFAILVLSFAFGILYWMRGHRGLTTQSRLAWASAVVSTFLWLPAVLVWPLVLLNPRFGLSNWPIGLASLFRHNEGRYYSTELHLSDALTFTLLLVASLWICTQPHRITIEHWAKKGQMSWPKSISLGFISAVLAIGLLSYVLLLVEGVYERQGYNIWGFGPQGSPPAIASWDHWLRNCRFRVAFVFGACWVTTTVAYRYFVSQKTTYEKKLKAVCTPLIVTAVFLGFAVIFGRDLLPSWRTHSMGSVGPSTVSVASWTCLLWCGGCMIAWLFSRSNRLRLDSPLCLGCRYDLRGTVAAGRNRCPECDMAIDQHQQCYVQREFGSKNRPGRDYDFSENES